MPIPVEILEGGHYPSHTKKILIQHRIVFCIIQSLSDFTAGHISTGGARNQFRWGLNSEKYLKISNKIFACPACESLLPILTVFASSSLIQDFHYPELMAQNYLKT